MSAPYRVRLRIGATQWDISKGDPAPDTLDGGVPLAPLTMGWKYPDDGGLWPTQPVPATVRLAIAYPSAAAADDVQIGSTFDCIVTTGQTYGGVDLQTARVAGRVAQRTATPRNITTPLGGTQPAWVLDLVLTDYTADLAETEVAGIDPLQGVGVRTRIAQLFSMAGMVAPAWSGGGSGSQQLLPDVTGQVQAETLSTAVDRYLKTYADGGEWVVDESVRTNHPEYVRQGWRRGVIRANLAGAETGEPNPLGPWRMEWISRRTVNDSDPSITYLPLQMVWRGTSETDGVWTLEPTDAPAGVLDLSRRISADYLDYDARWTRSKNTSAYRVIVSNNTDTTAYQTDWRQRAATLKNPGPDQTVIRITDCRAYRDFNAEFVAQMYLTDQVIPQDAPDKFVWRASEDPSWPRQITSWFPDSNTWQPASTPILITDLPPSQSPVNSGGYYAGVLSGVDFTIGRSRFSFTFTLRAGPPRPGGTTAELVAKWGDLPDVEADGEGPRTSSNIDPELRWSDFRLVRPLDLR